jgi:hypothetical protein
MKKLFATVIAAAFALSATSAFAANAQQDKMKTCQKEATDKALKGDERKKFVSECLKAGAPAAPAAAAPAPAAGPLAPKDAMKACMAAAKGKKGDEFKKFKEECLKAKGPANMK